MKKLLCYLFFCSILFSCVPAKKTTYFQGDPIQKSELYKLNNEPYRLQVNDILAIDIKAQNEENVSLFMTSNTPGSGGNLYFSGYTVDRHGNIRIPYIGDINVLGYTEKEVREKVEIELGKFLKKTEFIFVNVKLEGIKFTVTGEVGGPGTKLLVQNEVSIIDAIANAGEITEYGNKQDVTVIRKSLDGVKKYKIDLTNIDVFESEHFYIQPNDIIYVPPIKRKSWGLGTSGFQSFTTLVSVLTFLASTVLLVKNL